MMPEAAPAALTPAMINSDCLLLFYPTLDITVLGNASSIRPASRLIFFLMALDHPATRRAIPRSSLVDTPVEPVTSRARSATSAAGFFLLMGAVMGCSSRRGSASGWSPRASAFLHHRGPRLPWSTRHRDLLILRAFR